MSLSLSFSSIETAKSQNYDFVIIAFLKNSPAWASQADTGAADTVVTISRE